MSDDYAGGFSRYEVSEHARQEMEERQISTGQLQEVLTRPGQTERITETRIVIQSIITVDEKRYLFRAFVDVDREPPTVVTIYRTSKIEKYWSDTI